MPEIRTLTNLNLVTMKKIHFPVLCAIFLISLCVSCMSESDKARDFALEVGDKISRNMLDSVRVIYPDASGADSLALKFDPEQVKVQETDRKGSYIAEYAPGVTVSFEAVGDGVMRITGSMGIFAWNAETLRLAKEMGLIRDGISDAEKARAIRQLPKLMDLVYEEYKNSNSGTLPITVGEFVNEVTPLYTVDEGKGYYPLTNRSDHDIKGSDYQVRILQSAVLRFAANGDYEEHMVTRPGIDIPAGGTARYKVTYTQFSDNEVKGVVMKTKGKGEFLRDYQPTGEEYKLLEK